MKCWKCSAEVSPANNFCKRCGSSVAEHESVSTVSSKPSGKKGYLPIVPLLLTLVLILAGGGWFFASNASESGKQPDVESPILVDFICEHPEESSKAPVTPGSIPGELGAELTKLQTLVAGSKTELALSEDRVRSLQDQLARLQSELAGYKAERAHSEDNVRSVQDQLRQAQNDLAAYKKKAGLSEDRARSLEAELSKLQAELAACKRPPTKLDVVPQLSINVRHHHPGGGECHGVLEFSSGRMIFRSDEPSHQFNVAVDAVSKSFAASFAKGELQIRLTASGHEYQFSDNSSDDAQDCRALNGMKLDCREKD